MAPNTGKKKNEDGIQSHTLHNTLLPMARKTDGEGLQEQEPVPMKALCSWV
jgi:hypothetical protein